MVLHQDRSSTPEEETKLPEGTVIAEKVPEALPSVEGMKGTPIVRSPESLHLHPALLDLDDLDLSSS
jgi:hypothetical protein